MQLPRASCWPDGPESWPSKNIEYFYLFDYCNNIVFFGYREWYISYLTSRNSNMKKLQVSF